MAAVGMEHVTRRHGDVAVVRDLTIQVRDREFMVLLGPSGSGKTTTLRLVAGLEPVSEGRMDLRRLHRELGATVICTTHDQLEAMTLGDRIAVLRDGELQQVGTPRG